MKDSRTRPLDQLSAALDALELGLPLSAATAAWLVPAIRRWLRSTGEDSIEHFLNLTAADRYAWQMAQRDHFLRSAAQSCGDDISDWTRARRLGNEIELFECRVWPRLKNLASLPVEAPSLTRSLAQAFAVGLDVPRSAAQLHRLLARPPLHMQVDEGARSASIGGVEMHQTAAIKPNREATQAQRDALTRQWRGNPALQREFPQLQAYLRFHLATLNAPRHPDGLQLETKEI